MYMCDESGNVILRVDKDVKNRKYFTAWNFMYTVYIEIFES